MMFTKLVEAKEVVDFLTEIGISEYGAEEALLKAREDGIYVCIGVEKTYIVNSMGTTNDGRVIYRVTMAW